MSKKMFEAVVQKYEGVKKSIQERWESFKNKFEGSKSEFSQDVLKAETPEELLVVAEKIKNEAEAMKAEQDGIKQEESREDAAYENKRQAETNRAHDKVFEGHEKYEEASEMNRAFDENKAAEEAALEKAKIAEENKQSAEQDAAKRAEILAKINEESAPAESNENKRHDWESDPEFEALKNAFSEFHKPGDYNEEINKNWEDLSKKVFSRLKTTEDFKEVINFLKEERGAAYEKWDELTEKEIRGASSEDDMKRALKNMNPVIGRSKGDELRGIAYKKFPSLKEYFMNREPTFTYLGQIMKWEEGVVEKGRERMVDLEKKGQQTSEEYKKLHRLLVKTVDGKPVLKSNNEIPDRVAVNDVLNGE